MSLAGSGTWYCSTSLAYEGYRWATWARSSRLRGRPRSSWERGVGGRPVGAGDGGLDPPVDVGPVGGRGAGSVRALGRA